MDNYWIKRRKKREKDKFIRRLIHYLRTTHSNHKPALRA